jgi:hypothetical protein
VREREKKREKEDLSIHFAHRLTSLLYSFPFSFVSRSLNRKDTCRILLLYSIIKSNDKKRALLPIKGMTIIFPISNGK